MLDILHHYAMPSFILCTMPSQLENWHHQLAFLTPGILPARAFSLKGNYTCPMSDQDISCMYGIGLTLAILKSFSTPLDFPPSIHLLLICVDLV